MTDRGHRREAWAATEPQPFDVWLTTAMRSRYGETERLSEDWFALVDAVRLPDH